MVRFSVQITIPLLLACCLILASCHTHRTSRNPVFKTRCPVHHEVLIKTEVSNERGAWCEINFDPEKTPYPKVGICNGCCGGPSTSMIKYCPKCGNGHDKFK